MKKFMSFIVCLLAFVVGIGGGAGYIWYASLPETEELVLGEEVFYSYNDGEISTAEFDNGTDVFSVHFVELGNKYTGDCTYIKYGDVDILIDCGSRANSVGAVSNYLNQYVTDNTLEYVIVTHAHRDHYAGFATSTKVSSIFDLYVCETIIDFGNATNQDADASTYKNYLRERNAEIEAGATHVKAVDCGIRISETFFNSFKSAWSDDLVNRYSGGQYAKFSDNFEAGDHKATGRYKGCICYEASAVEGLTIFWKKTDDPSFTGGYY